MSHYGYARISRDEDKSNYATIIAQKNIIDNYAKENNIKLEYIFEDDNYSGYSFDRPDFNKLLRIIDEEKVSTLIVKDLSRIGRHNAHTLLFLEQLSKNNIRLISIDDNYDTTKDDDTVIGIKSWYNELYIKDISRKIRSNIKTQQKEGTYACAVPYGYRLDKDKNIHIVEECVKYIQKIFQLYIDGNGVRKIISYLEENNIPTPSVIIKKLREQEGKTYKKHISPHWQAKAVLNILRNDFYIGTFRCRKYQIQGINGKYKKIDKEDQCVFEDHHLAIIDKRTFELVQEILDKRKKTHYRGQKFHKNLYAGFLFCADCGSFMCSLNKEGKNKSYICGTYNQRGRNGCTTHYILDGKLNEIITDIVIEFKDQFKNVLMDINKNIKEEILSSKNIETTIKKLIKQKDILKSELKITISQKIKDMIKYKNNEKLIREQYEELENEKQTEINIIDNEIEELKNIITDKKDIEENTNKAIEVFDNIINNGIQRRDLELIIDKIIVHQGGDVDIKFKDSLEKVINKNHSDDVGGRVGKHYDTNTISAINYIVKNYGKAS